MCRAGELFRLPSLLPEDARRRPVAIGTGCGLSYIMGKCDRVYQFSGCRSKKGCSRNKLLGQVTEQIFKNRTLE